MTHTEERNNRVRNSLLQKYPADEYGIWHVKGEDDNADMVGPHHMPTLGFFEGNYSDIVEYSLELKGFWTWGSGGNIYPVTVKKIDPAATRELKETVEALIVLEEQKKALVEKLKELEGG